MKKSHVSIVAGFLVFSCGVPAAFSQQQLPTPTIQPHSPSPIPNQSNQPWETWTIEAGGQILAIVHHVVRTCDTPTAEIPIQNVNTPTTVQIPRVNLPKPRRWWCPWR